LEGALAGTDLSVLDGQMVGRYYTCDVLLLVVCGKQLHVHGRDWLCSRKGRNTAVAAAAGDATAAAAAPHGGLHFG
jgi:hypothetical protein